MGSNHIHANQGFHERKCEPQVVDIYTLWAGHVGLHVHQGQTAKVKILNEVIHNRNEESNEF